jgi:hypothetical protein
VNRGRRDATRTERQPPNDDACDGGSGGAALGVRLTAPRGESALSLQNTARQALFLGSKRVEKYVGKTMVDTVIVRVGAAMTALVVWAGSRAALSALAFTTLNLVLVAIWFLAVLAIGKENARRAESPDRIGAEPLPE